MGRKSLKANAFLSVIKQLCAIIFPLITFPYASRILGTDTYGKINFSASIISYITMIAALGINNYAVREGSRVRNDKSRFQKLVNELFSINCISTAISYLILFLLIVFWRRLDGYALLLLIQSMTVLFTTIGTDWVNTIEEDFLYITVRYIVCQALAVVFMFAFVHAPEDYLFYAAASASGTVLANLSNIFYIRKKYDIHPRFTLHINAAVHMTPIMFLFGSAVASQIYINSDVTILGILRSDTEVGLYSVSAKIYGMVKQILNAMLVVAIPRISTYIGAGEKERINSTLSSILNSLLLTAMPACAGLFMLSENIVLLISGREYIGASSSLQILAISLFFATTACLYVNVVMIPFRLEKKALLATIVSGTTNIVLNFVLIPYWGQNAAAFTTLLSEMIMFFMGYFYTRRLVHLTAGRDFLISLLNIAIVTASCVLCRKVFARNLIVIFMAVCLSVVGCVITLALFDHDKYRNLIGIIKRKLRR